MNRVSTTFLAFWENSPELTYLHQIGKIARVEPGSLNSLRVYLYEDEKEPSSCPFAFMDAQRQTESEPPSAQTLALWHAISFHGG